MQQRTISRRVLALLFCIAVLSIGMYAPNTGVDSFFSYSDSPRILSAAFGNTHRMDVTNEKYGDIADEITASISSGTRNTFSYRILPLKFFFSTAVLPFIPLFIWIVFKVLLQNEFVDRMYLILFIHNSDGKKGDLAGI